MTVGSMTGVTGDDGAARASVSYDNVRNNLNSAFDPEHLVRVVPDRLVDRRPRAGCVQQRTCGGEDCRPVAPAHCNHDDLGHEGRVRRQQHDA